ncbi:MAG: DNA polymerase III subunit alpha, partial [Caulobacteraceae bacterium]
YELIASGSTVGVFQMEGQGMRDTLRKLRPATVEEITALISLYRPGPMDSIDEYVEGKMGRRPICILPGLEEALGETYGVIVYQEQVMQIARILAGYSLGEADVLRRAMGKKKPAEMARQRARFVSGAAEKGLSEAEASAMFDRMAKFAGYGFNKCHAAPYALICYQTAWLKANAPVEFFAASMNLDISNTDKLAVFHHDARRLGVVILPPDINRSGAEFEVADGQVLYALGAVRNVGRAAMDHVVEVRSRGGPFRDLFDFLERVDPRQVNKRALESLARAGAMDSIHPDRAQLVAAADQLINWAQGAAADRAASQESLFSGAAEAGRPRLPKAATWTPIERLEEELAAVGFYLSGHPLEDMTEVLRRRGVDLYAEAAAKFAHGAEAFRLAGVVHRRRERTGGADGSRFAVVSLSDPTGAFEVRFQGDALRRLRDRLEPGASVVIRAKARAGDGDLSFFGDDAEALEKTIEKVGSNLRVHLSAKEVEWGSLKKRLSPVASGGGEVRLVAALSSGREIELKLPGRFLLDPEHRGALKIAPGVSQLEDI